MSLETFNDPKYPREKKTCCAVGSSSCTPSHRVLKPSNLQWVRWEQGFINSSFYSCDFGTCFVSSLLFLFLEWLQPLLPSYCAGIWDYFEIWPGGLNRQPEGQMVAAQPHWNPRLREVKPVEYLRKALTSLGRREPGVGRGAVDRVTVPLFSPAMCVL